MERGLGGPDLFTNAAWGGMRFCTLILLVGISACASTHTVNFTDIVGNKCKTVHANPVWWSGEDSTTCLRDGKVVDVPTNHTDLSMLMFLGAFGAIGAALIGVL